MLGLAMLVRFAHAMENMLERLRSGEIALDEHLINLLLACNDQLRDLLQGAEHNPELQQTETQQILALLSQLQGHQTLPSQPLIMPAPAPANLADRRAWHLSLRFYPALYQDGFDLLAFIRYLGNLGRSTSSSRSGRSGPRCNCSMPPSVFSATRLACSALNLLSGSGAPLISLPTPVSSVCSAPIRIWRSFQNRDKSWQPGAMSRSRPSCSAGCRPVPWAKRKQPASRGAN